jgi:hypothetical protein
MVPVSFSHDAGGWIEEGPDSVPYIGSQTVNGKWETSTRRVECIPKIQMQNLAPQPRSLGFEAET